MSGGGCFRIKRIACRPDGPDHILFVLAVKRSAQPPDVDVDGAGIDIDVVRGAP